MDLTKENKKMKNSSLFPLLLGVNVLILSLTCHARGVDKLHPALNN
jgi:hypothetical protein